MKHLTVGAEAHQTYYNALIYGPPGTGKTTLGVTCPEPILTLLSEQNGHHHVLAAAARLGRKCPQVVFIEQVDDLRDIVNLLYGDRSKPLKIGGLTYEWPATVVVDQLSDIARMIFKELEKKHPPKPGKDGLPAKARNWWPLVEDGVRNMIKALRDAPNHTLFLAELDEKFESDDDGKQTLVSFGPVMPMKTLTRAIAHAVSMIGHTYRTIDPVKRGPDGNKLIVYGVGTVGPQCYVVKPLRPLNDREVPDFASWVRRLDGSVEKVEMPVAPDEMRSAPAEVAEAKI